MCMCMYVCVCVCVCVCESAGASCTSGAAGWYLPFSLEGLGTKFTAGSSNVCVTDHDQDVCMLKHSGCSGEFGVVGWVGLFCLR